MRAHSLKAPPSIAMRPAREVKNESAFLSYKTSYLGAFFLLLLGAVVEGGAAQQNENQPEAGETAGEGPDRPETDVCEQVSAKRRADYSTESAWR